MKQLRLLGLLFTPSLSSALLAFVVAAMIIGVADWSFIQHQHLFYDSLFGRYGLVTALERAPDTFTAFKSTLFKSPLTYNLAVVVIAAMVGAIVYTLLEGFRHTLEGTSNAITEIELATPTTRKVVEEEIIVRLFLRVTSLALWYFYWILFIGVMIPYCIMFSRTGVEQISGTDISGVGFVALGLVILMIGVHVHIVFARLSMLRPRLFGGHDVIATILYE